MRTPVTPSAAVIRIRDLREQYPRWGREKIRVLLEREGITISAKTVDRTLARLRARNELREPKAVRRSHEMRLRAFARTRRPIGLVVDRPGFLQIDTQELRKGGPFTYAAIDHLTRKRVLGAAKRNTALEATRFLERARAVFPFAIWAVQTDGGSEYMAEFAQAVEALGITQYVNRPNYPKGQGRVERSFLTDDLEFHQVEGVWALAAPRLVQCPELRALWWLACPGGCQSKRAAEQTRLSGGWSWHTALTTRTNTA